MSQTYCTYADLESMLSVAGVLAFIDDSENGTASGAETQYATDAIERAAAKMNADLDEVYILSQLASNVWCKWANATLAIYELSKRRNNPCPASLIDDVKEITERLRDIGMGRARVPEQAPSFDSYPAVTNYAVERGRGIMPVRPRVSESTGAAQDESRKRYPAREPPYQD